MSEDKEPSGTRVGEARLEYWTSRPEEQDAGETRLSAKNQLTIPAGMLRTIGWKAGDTLSLWMQGETIVIDRIPQTADEWLAYLHRRLSGIDEWSTDEKIEAYTREERDWDTRDDEWDR